jgi:hypothetical protein
MVVRLPCPQTRRREDGVWERDWVCPVESQGISHPFINQLALILKAGQASAKFVLHLKRLMDTIDTIYVDTNQVGEKDFGSSQPEESSSQAHHEELVMMGRDIPVAACHGMLKDSKGADSTSR